MEDGQRALVVRIAQVGIERGQLVRGEQALVDERARRERRDVQAGRGQAVLERPTFELLARQDTARRSKASASIPAAGATSTWRMRGRVRRAAAPSSSAITGTSRQPSTSVQRSRSLRQRVARHTASSGWAERSLGQNSMPTPSRSPSSSRTPSARPRRGHKPARDLGQDAGAVAALAVGGNRAAVREVGHRLDRLSDDVVAGLAADSGDEPHAARIVLEARVIQPRRRWDVRRPNSGLLAHVVKPFKLRWRTLASTKKPACRSTRRPRSARGGAPTDDAAYAAATGRAIDPRPPMVARFWHICP